MLGGWPTRVVRVFIVLAIASALTLLRTGTSLAAAFTVTNTNDSGAGSLRQAILDANASPGNDVINFMIGSGPQTITPVSPLPSITDTVIINGASQPGFSGTPFIDINGSNIGGAPGLVIAAGGSVVEGLAINAFGDGIVITGAGGNLIANDDISGNHGAGIHVQNSPKNTIQGQFFNSNFSTFAGNGGPGILIEGIQSTGNIVRHDFIGVRGGAAPQSNSIGVEISAFASNNTVGGTFASNDMNVISANGTNVKIDSGASSNTIEGNHIGTDLSGMAAVGGDWGVAIVAASNNTIGGTVSGAGNVISGHRVFGILVCGNGSLICNAATDATGNVIQGNVIGTTADGMQALGNGQGAPTATGAGGIFINDATANTIGGGTGAGNVISGNQNGVTIVVEGPHPGNDIVFGNVIGATPDGLAPLGNVDFGVEIGDSGNNSVDRNLISSNGFDGVFIVDFGGSAGNTQFNEVRGNTIGTDATHSFARPNGHDGVRIAADSHDNTIADNTIAGNAGHGIELFGFFPAPSSNTISGNMIGIATSGRSTFGIANGGDGILVAAGQANAIEGNVISSNKGSGLVFNGTGDQIIGNRVGTDPSGTGRMPNLGDGISQSGGGTNTIGNNIISGNNRNGLVLNATGDTVVGNDIGTDPSGIVRVSNLGDGIRELAGSTNTIQGNLVSGNNSTGLESHANGDHIVGNLIGTNAAGNAALGNVIGLWIGGANDAVSGNTVSGNGDDGVDLAGGPGNVLSGNKIGTDSNGAKAIPNNVGVFVTAPGNSIGTASSGNVISGNRRNGVWVAGGGDGTTIQGNEIGTAASGLAALGNGGVGVRLEASTRNIIGGLTASPGMAPGNVISGNGLNGVDMVVPTGATTGNVVEGNIIGLNKSGQAAIPNGGDGVLINGVPRNVIGGTTTSARNVISGNRANGVEITGANGNRVFGNDIGTQKDGKSALGNAVNGVFIHNAASGNQVGGGSSAASNVIAFNGKSGVLVGGSSADSATHDSIRRNSIFGNRGFGIDLAPQGIVNCLTKPPGPNDYTPCPVIKTASLTTVTGTACPGCTVEVFIATNEADDLGHGEGKTFLGSVVANTTGAWSLSLLAGQVTHGTPLTATATRPASATRAAETSEFAANVTVR